MKQNMLTIQNIDLPREYGVTDAAISELAKKYADVTEIKDSATLSLAVAGRREHRELRVAVEHKRKELKAGALEFGRKVDGEAKRITEELVKTESRLDELIKAEEARKEEERQAKLRAIAEAEAKERARVDGIRQTIEIQFGAYRQLELPSLPIEDLTQLLHITEEITDESGYAEFTEEAKVKREEFLGMADKILKQKQEAEAEAERQRIEAERLAEERRAFEEEQRIAREKAQAEQAERDRIEAERQAKIREEQEAIEAQRRKVREEQEAFEAEKRRIEEELLAKERAEREALERAEFEAQARIRAEKEATEKKEREEKERQAAEAAEKKRREENTRIRNKTKKDAVEAMVECGTSQKDAEIIFDAIDSGKIPKVSIQY